MVTRIEADQLNYVSLPANPYSLGMVTEFLSRFKPFTEFELGPIVSALAYQLGTESNLVTSQNDVMVGYIGWILTAEEVAASWVRFGGVLTPSEDGDVAVVTILATSDPRTLRHSLKQARERCKVRKVYWRRLYTETSRSFNRSLTLGLRDGVSE